MNPIETTRERQLCALMESCGDAVLRSCILLCGHPNHARQAARRVFMLAAAEPAMPQPLGRGETPRRLLALVMRHCPCPLLPPRPQDCAPPLSGFLALPPAQRRVAVLCCYHGLTAADAASLLRMPTAAAARHLARARRRLGRL